MKKRLFPLAVVWLAALVLGACALGPPRVTTDFDRSYTFTHIKTVAFEPFTAKGDNLMLSDMQKNRLREMMMAVLRQRGYDVVAKNESPDALLNWHLVTRERTSVRTYSHNTTPPLHWHCWYCGPWMSTQVSMDEYTEGTHILDMIDPARKEGVWRAVVSVPLSLHADPERADRQLQAIAAALLSEFPPRGVDQDAPVGSD